MLPTESAETVACVKSAIMDLLSVSGEVNG
jgi:hypothetical protein